MKRLAFYLVGFAAGLALAWGLEQLEYERFVRKEMKELSIALEGLE